MNMDIRRCLEISRRLGELVLALSALDAKAQTSPEIIWQRQENSDRINSVTFSSDGNTFITGSSDRLINFWNTADGTLLRVLNSNAPPVHESSIESVAITSDGTRLATASYRVAKLWRLPAGTSQNLAHSDWVVGVAFSPSGALLATASFDRSIRVWRSSDGAAVRSFPNQNGQMRTVAFSPDGNYLAAAGGEISAFASGAPPPGSYSVPFTATRTTFTVLLFPLTASFWLQAAMTRH